MIQPDELKKNEPLVWSAGTGTDVWEMFCAAMAFGQTEMVTFLLKRGAKPQLPHDPFWATPLTWAPDEDM